MNDVFAPGDDLMELSKYAFNILADFPPKEAPIRPETAAAMRQAKPLGSPCLPGSISFINLIPATIKWIQTPEMIVIIAGNKAALDSVGHPHSEVLNLTERYRRHDFSHLDVELTVDDAKMYTRPFTIKYTQLFQPN